MMTSSCTCALCVCVLVLKFFLLRFQTERLGCSRGSTQKTELIATFFLIYIYIYIYIYRKKRNEKRLLLTLKRRPPIIIVAFVLSMQYCDAQTLSCFNPFLVLFPSTQFPFLSFLLVFLSFSCSLSLSNV